MLNYEYHYGPIPKEGENVLGIHWLDRLFNSPRFLVDTDRITSTCWAKGFKWQGQWTDSQFIGTDIWRYLDVDTPVLDSNGEPINAMSSMFWNAKEFERHVFVDGKLAGKFHMRRWTDTGRRQYIQYGKGIKINGRWAGTFRIQSDDSSAKGTWGPNYGQAKGWDFGPH